MSTTSLYSLYGAMDSWHHSLNESKMARFVWALSDEEYYFNGIHATRWNPSIIKEIKFASIRA
jgi:hypothetical protein